jgi:hypothetical protein
MGRVEQTHENENREKESGEEEGDVSDHARLTCNDTAGFDKLKRPTLRFQPDSVKHDAATYTRADHIQI